MTAIPLASDAWTTLPSSVAGRRVAKRRGDARVGQLQLRAVDRALVGCTRPGIGTSACVSTCRFEKFLRAASDNVRDRPPRFEQRPVLATGRWPA
jgi:hypothetical protein